MANHGPFTIGRTARSAVKTAAMCEEVARTVTIARQGGDPHPLEPDQIDALYHRYQNAYGQTSPKDGPLMTSSGQQAPPAPAARSGF